MLYIAGLKYVAQVFQVYASKSLKILYKQAASLQLNNKAQRH